DQVSAIDCGNNVDPQVNWRLPGGYGALISALAEGLPVRLATPVSAIDWRGRVVTVETPAGSLSARQVILCVPSTVLAGGAIAFTPDLPADKRQAAADLPLGADLKLFLKVEGAPFGPPRDHQLPTRYDRAETGFMHVHPFGRP